MPNVSSPPEYKPVPVEAARQLADQFDKDIVVIVCWDWLHQLLHTTTYGKSALDKQHAALLGDMLNKRAGGDLEQARAYEDYRTRPQAELTAEIDGWRRRAEAAEARLDRVAKHIVGQGVPLAEVQTVMGLESVEPLLKHVPGPPDHPRPAERREWA